MGKENKGDLSIILAQIAWFRQKSGAHDFDTTEPGSRMCDYRGLKVKKVTQNKTDYIGIPFAPQKKHRRRPPEENRC